MLSKRAILITHEVKDKMISLILQIIKFVIVRLASAKILSTFNSQLLKIDSWLEKHLNIDIIKQEEKFYQKYPNIEKRLKDIEKKLEEKSNE